MIKDAQDCIVVNLFLMAEMIVWAMKTLKSKTKKLWTGEDLLTVPKERVAVPMIFITN